MDPLSKRFKEALKEDGEPLHYHVADEYLGFMDGVYDSAEALPDGAFIAYLVDNTEEWLYKKRLYRTDAHGLVMTYLRARSELNEEAE